MYLIQFLLPLYNNEGIPFDKKVFNNIEEELTQYAGGITSYKRTPATGLWKETNKKTICDEVILFEIMIDNIDIAFWNAYKIKLQQLLTQNEIIIRASSIQLL